MKNNTTLTTKDLGNTTVNADLNTNLVKLLEIYGQNLQILGHAVTEVNNKVASVEQRLEDVGNFIEELRVDHLELKQLAKVAKNVRDRYKNLFEQKAVLYDVSTHAITKIFDYVMYSMMFEYIDKKKVVLGSNVTSAIALSTKDLIGECEI